MKRIGIRVRALEPLVIGDGATTDQNVRHTLDHIPGGVLRGALAQRALELLGKHATSGRSLPQSAASSLQEAFEQCLLHSNGVRFSFLYPHENGALPAPCTALQPKRTEEARQLYDTLYPLICDQDWQMEDPEQPGRRLERVRGYLSPHNGSWNPVKTPPKRTFTRVGLNRKTETAQEGILYLMEAILPEYPPSKTASPASADGEDHSPPTQVSFSGTLTFQSKAQYEQFRQLLQHLLPDGKLRIGSARARGFGLVSVEIGDELPLPDIESGLDAFHKETGKPIFTLTATSPVIVLKGGRPAETLTPELLNRYLPGLPDSVQLMEKATRIERERVGGWSQAWGLPKPLTHAIARGSVFTYQYDPAQRNDLVNWLQQLAWNGLGLRTHEGYGQFEICWSFHLQKRIPPIGGDSK